MSDATRGLGRRSARLRTTAIPVAPKKTSTKQLLIETGERLFGQHGFDGISLREIAIAAGQANTNVVQYHFKNKAGLVSAILEDRVYGFENLRSEMLEALSKDSSAYTRELLRILWLPSMTIRDQDGNHTFCRFLLQYMIQPHIAPHPLARFYNASAEPSAEGQELAFVQATHLLRSYYKNLPQPLLNRRMSALSMMFLATVVEHDNAQLLSENVAPTEFDIEPILTMSIAALEALV